MKLLVGEQWNKGSTALFLGGKIGYSQIVPLLNQ